MQNVVNSISLPKINFRVVFTFFFAIILCLSIFYVVGVNKLTGGSYTVKNLENKIKILSQEKAVLQTNFAKLGFLDNIQARTSLLNFKKTAEVKYIQIVDLSVAKAK